MLKKIIMVKIHFKKGVYHNSMSQSIIHQNCHLCVDAAETPYNLLCKIVSLLRQYMKMNLLKMFNIFIYKISDVDTNHVNLPLEKLQLVLDSRTKNLKFLSCQCKSILDVFKLQKQPSTLTIQKDFSKRKITVFGLENLCLH